MAYGRVIVVLPFLSIIEQNAAIYREVLGSDVVVEHHSAVEHRSRPKQSARGAVSRRIGSKSRRPTKGWEWTRSELADRLATENWDAPIIVTTAVQFLESLLAQAFALSETSQHRPLGRALRRSAVAPAQSSRADSEHVA